ncbi:MAG: hypothetical protein QXH37_08315 [Candidatus Bathyarchaeia archaeon]
MKDVIKNVRFVKAEVKTFIWGNERYQYCCENCGFKTTSYKKAKNHKESTGHDVALPPRIPREGVVLFIEVNGNDKPRLMKEEDCGAKCVQIPKKLEKDFELIAKQIIEEGEGLKSNRFYPMTKQSAEALLAFYMAATKIK